MKSIQTKQYRKGGMREMFAIAFPMVVSQTCDTVMVFTDRLFLSKLGPEQMNAAMAGGLASWVLITFFMGLIGYSTALVAQYYGAKKFEKCPIATGQSVLISFVAYPFILLFIPLANKIFGLIGFPADQLPPLKTYFSLVVFATIFGLLRTSFSSFFSGLGRTRIVMISALTAMLVNVVCNYILIFGHFGFPAMGIKGAAIGTMLGGFTGFMVLLIASVRISKELGFDPLSSLRYDKEVMKKLIHYGSPAGLEFFLNFLAFTIMVYVFQSHSPVTGTAATILFNWDMVSFVPLIGIEIGVTSLVGRYMGSHDPETAKKATYSGIKIGLIFSAFIFIAFVFFPEQLVYAFSPNEDNATFNAAVPLAVFMIQVASFYVLLEAILIAIIGTLRGAGDTHWAMRMSVSIHYVFVVILWLMLHQFNMSPREGWIAVVMIFFVFILVFYNRFRKGKWQDLKVVD